MKIAKCTLKSVSPYSQNKYYKTPKDEKELSAAYEERTWRDRCHTDKDNNIIIPPMVFANSLKEAAKYMSIPIPGKSKQTFTKNFEAGILVTDPITLPIKKENVEGEWLFVPSNGQRGSGSRVEKCFPVIREWEGVVTYYILDDIITEDVFKRVLDTCGNLIGVGRFRPRNLGYYGRFRVVKVEWKEQK